MAAHPSVPNRIQPAGFVPDCDWSGNITTLFQRDPCWLQLVDPSPVIEAMDMALGEACHLVNQKGWRNHPGHNAHGSFHADEIFVELPEELAADPRMSARASPLASLICTRSVIQRLPRPEEPSKDS